MNLNELLQVALDAANTGAAELKQRYRGPLEISSKTSPEDHVTDADLASETLVRALIHERRPNDSITGEEFAGLENAAAEVRWSIDPLDGTVNFTRGLPNFCTSVGAANVETGEWLVGAIVAPILDLTYYAKRGQGSFVIRNGQHIKLTGPPADRATKIIATGFSYQAEERVAQFENMARMMPDFVDLRRMGAAALDLCAVAEGAIDVYYERGIKEYDWAAGALIAEEAGLTVQRPDFVGDLCHARLV